MGCARLLALSINRGLRLSMNKLWPLIVIHITTGLALGSTDTNLVSLTGPRLKAAAVALKDFTGKSNSPDLKHFSVSVGETEHSYEVLFIAQNRFATDKMHGGEPLLGVQVRYNISKSKFDIESKILEGQHPGLSPAQIRERILGTWTRVVPYSKGRLTMLSFGADGVIEKRSGDAVSGQAFWRPEELATDAIAVTEKRSDPAGPAGLWTIWYLDEHDLVMFTGGTSAAGPPERYRR